MKKIVFLLCLVFVSCASMQVSTDISDGLEDVSLNVLWLSQRDLNIYKALSKQLKQFPPNVGGEVYVFVIRKYQKRDYIIIQNWGCEILKTAHYSCMGVFSPQKNTIFLLCYDNKKSRSELEKIFSKSNKYSTINLLKESLENESHQVCGDMTTYFVGEIVGDSIEVKKMIINNRVVKTLSEINQK